MPITVIEGEWMIVRVGKISVVILTAAVTGSCGKTILQVMGGGSTNIVGLNVAPAGEGLYDRCGIRIKDLADSSAKLADIKLRSDVRVTGSSSGLNYNFLMQANVHIVASAGRSVAETLLQLKENKSDDVDKDGVGRITTDLAKQAAYDNSTRVTSDSMSTGLLLKLQKTDERFKDVECAVTFTGKQTTETADSIGVVEFTPGIPNAVNPRASIATYDLELGASRSFTVKAKVIKAAKDWLPEGTETDVTIAFKRVPSDQKSAAGMPANAPAVTADVAYEMITTSPAGDVWKMGLSKRQIFYINTTDRDLVGALSDMGRKDPKLKTEFPPVFAVPVTE